MLSGPEALLVFSDLISLSMPSVEKELREMLDRYIEINQISHHE